MLTGCFSNERPRELSPQVLTGILHACRDLWHACRHVRLTSRPPRNLAPLGEFFVPLTRCHMPPPTAPMPKAPPMSPSILYGHGSLPWSTPARAYMWCEGDTIRDTVRRTGLMLFQQPYSPMAACSSFCRAVHARGATDVPQRPAQGWLLASSRSCASVNMAAA